MMKLTKKADYGLIALKHLAMYGHVGSVSAKDIADCYGIPQALLAKILQKLARNGFLQSQHGTRGGYLLARDPAQITALEVIRLIDGPVLLTSCETPRGACDHTEKCNVREPLRKVHDTLLGLLGALTISELSREEEAASACTCAPAAPGSVALPVL
jgi:Rrf2 family protein